MLKVAFNCASAIKNIVSQNQDLFEKLQLFWIDETKCNEILKKLKIVKELNTKAVTLGVIVEFRKLLYATMSEVLEKSTPVMNNCDSTLKEIEGIRKADVVENINTGLAHALRNICAPNDGVDRTLWQLLPIVFGASIAALGEEGSVFSNSLDGYESNGQFITSAFNA